MVPKDQVLRLIAGFSALGADKFVITGGEPLTHPDWFEILSFACSLPGVCEVRLQTNAILLTPMHVDALVSLKDRGLIIQTSLEGTTPQTHDHVRGRARILAGLLEGGGEGGRPGLGAHEPEAAVALRDHTVDVDDGDGGIQSPALLAQAALGQVLTGEQRLGSAFRVQQILDLVRVQQRVHQLSFLGLRGTETRLVDEKVHRGHVDAAAL